MAMRARLTHLSVILIACCAGCGSTRVTDTSRTGLEQILISNAIDRSLDEFDLAMVNGYRVFVDEKNLECTDKKYVIGSLRRRLLADGGQLVDKPEDAAIVVEVHSGGVGTDRSEGFLGIPAANLPGPIPIGLPEVKLLSQQTHYGSAKIGLVAYDAKSRRSLGEGGVSLARSNNSSWSILGIGPFNSGSIPKELATASQDTATNDLKRRIGLGKESTDRKPKTALVEPQLLIPPALVSTPPAPATVSPPVASNVPPPVASNVPPQAASNAPPAGSSAPPPSSPWVYPAGAQAPPFLPPGIVQPNPSAVQRN